MQGQGGGGGGQEAGRRSREGVQVIAHRLLRFPTDGVV